MDTANDNLRSSGISPAQAHAQAAIAFFEQSEYESWGFPENVPFLLRRIENVESNTSEAIAVLKYRYQIAYYFVSLLQQAMQVRREEGFSEDDALIQAIHRNFLDETGGYGSEPPHEQGRRDALVALGVQYDEWIEELLKMPASSSEHFLREYKHLLSENSLAAGTALLYYEGRIHRKGRGDYCRIQKGFENIFPHLKKERYTPGDALYHISSHASHDVIHEKELTHGVVTAVRSMADVETVQSMLTRAQQLWNAYWELLGKEILGEPVEQVQ